MILSKDFLWGGSVSNMQIEGAYDEGGRGLSDYDVRPVKNGAADWKVAIDFYHNYKEDIKLFSELGLNTYRFSICWSRVLPEGEGKVNEEGLRFYDNVIDELLKYHIEPFICVNHFELPLALVKKYGGWHNRAMIEAWKQFVKILVDRYAEKVKYWVPFNEQNAFQELASPALFKIVSHEQIGADEIMECDRIAIAAVHNTNVASSWLRKYLSECGRPVNKGGMINYRPVYPYDCNPLAIYKAKKQEEFYAAITTDVMAYGEYSHEFRTSLKKYGLTLPIEEGDEDLLKKYTVDFIAFSYYGSGLVSADDALETNPFSMAKMISGMIVPDKNALTNPYLKATQWDWTIDPLGLRVSLNNLYRRYRLPLIILECGLGIKEELNEDLTVEDDYRIDYFREHITAMKDAVAIDGVDLRGFLTWGPIDILSSQGEMRKRYGFIFVNRTDDDLRDLKRYKKKSFAWFRHVIDTNGEEL